MKKKLVYLMLVGAVSASMLAGCGQTQETATQEPAAVVEETPAKEEAPVEEEVVEETLVEEEVVDDQAKADEVAALIDAIYVQTRTDETDAQCEAAKKAWDALTDAQKELVEGEEADPDYFGRDTGDASLDDTLNQDEIGENEILVVSFGTSFNDSRAKDISGVEKAIAAAYPDWSVRRAFTAQIIINHVQAREGQKIDNMEQALDRAVANGVKNLIIQPTHLMQGAEYDELKEALEGYALKFEKVVVAKPLLGEVGNDASVINADKETVAIAITEEAVAAAGFESLDAAKEDGTAFVYMGHGTSHTAKVSYSQMTTQFEKLGYENVFVGTVEGEPEETACENVIEAVKEAGFTKVILRPLMVVAGDHANNDMAGDEEDSWKSMFVASGAFESVDCQIAGLGGISKVQDLYVAHTNEAIAQLDSIEANVVETESTGATASETLADGEYEVVVDTDSSMFRVNEAMDGKGTLTVKGGEMTLHITLSGTGFLHLYAGSAEAAAADEANWLDPITETVTYADGTSEEVYAYDIPVAALGNSIQVAAVGSKEKWYDHVIDITLNN